ncbi:MAG: hypothetical protein JW982_06180 [Spirochaetes bacterium]|nr:hypothetical protein [Spirochaetota bacterium]
MYHTSLNINRAIYKIIAESAEKYNVSICYIIRKLISKMLVNFDFALKQKTLTEYQCKYPECIYKRFHITFSENEIEANFKARLDYKISVSKILILGFILFFHEIIKELDGNEKIVIEYLNNYSKILKELYKNLKKSINKRIRTDKIKEDNLILYYEEP